MLFVHVYWFICTFSPSLCWSTNWGLTWRPKCVGLCQPKCNVRWFPLYRSALYPLIYGPTWSCCIFHVPCVYVYISSRHHNILSRIFTQMFVCLFVSFVCWHPPFFSTPMGHHLINFYTLPVASCFLLLLYLCCYIWLTFDCATKF